MSDTAPLKDVHINVRLTSAELAALKQAACAEERSISSLARLWVADRLKANGWLPGAPKGSKR